MRKEPEGFSDRSSLLSHSATAVEYFTGESRMIKGILTRDFRLLFFHQTTYPGSLIHRLKPFRIWLRFAKIIDKVGCKAVSLTPL
jgi:hypothetical protein